MECLEWCPHEAPAVLGAIQWGPIGLVFHGGDSRPLCIVLPQGLSFVLTSLCWGMRYILAPASVLSRPGVCLSQWGQSISNLQLHLLQPLACVPFFPWITVLGCHTPWIDRQNL